MIGPGSLLLLLLAPAPAAARDSVYLLPEVRVERERARYESARLRQPTGYVADLPAGTDGRGLVTISEVLAGSAGVRVVQYGGLGAFSTVSLRGAPAGQVSVFLDGTPITSAAHGVVDLADLPVTAVERIEVYRGAAPLDLGLVTPGGAINLVTASTPRLFDARVTRGSFGTWEGRTTAGGRRGVFSALVHGGAQSSHGDFRFFDDNGTPLNAADDSMSARVNNRFRSGTLLASVSWRPDALSRVTLREDVFRKDQGLSGLGTIPARSAHLAFTRSVTQFSAERDGGRWLPGVRARAGLQRERSRFRDLAGIGELGLGHHDTDDRFAGEDASLGLRWTALPLGLGFEAGTSARAERAALADRADPFVDPPHSRRGGAGALLIAQWHSPGDRLLLRAGRRWDRLHDRIASTGVGNRVQVSTTTRVLDSPQLGARLTAGAGVELRGNWSAAQRAPDFLELFGNQGFVVGNPALRPERGSNWDAGASWSGALRRVRATAEWAHFESRPRDLIQYARLSQSYVRAANVTRARLGGEEVSLRIVTARGASLAANATWLRARDDGTIPYLRGKRLPQRPERQGFVRLDAPAGALRVAAEVQYIGDDMLDPYNRMRVPSRTLLGAALSWQVVRDHLRLTIEGKNLADRRVADIAGYPLPGRSLFVACEALVGPAEPIHH